MRRAAAEKSAPPAGFECGFISNASTIPTNAHAGSCTQCAAFSSSATSDWGGADHRPRTARINLADLAIAVLVEGTLSLPPGLLASHGYGFSQSILMFSRPRL